MIGTISAKLDALDLRNPKRFRGMEDRNRQNLASFVIKIVIGQGRCDQSRRIISRRRIILKREKRKEGRIDTKKNISQWLSGNDSDTDFATIQLSIESRIFSFSRRYNEVSIEERSSCNRQGRKEVARY